MRSMLLAISLLAVNAWGNEAFWVDIDSSDTFNATTQQRNNATTQQRNNATTQQRNNATTQQHNSSFSHLLTNQLDNYRLLSLSEDSLRYQLEAALNPSQLGMRSPTTDIDVSTEMTFPLPDGKFVTVRVIRDDFLSPELLEAHPEIQSYAVLPDNNVWGGSITVTPKGINVMLMLPSGDTVFIDPQEDMGQRQYVSYSERSNQRLLNEAMDGFSCNALSNKKSSDAGFDMVMPSDVLPAQETATANRQIATRPLRTYRLAVAATGEYTAQYGGGNAQNTWTHIVSIINRVRPVFKRDLSVDFQLVSAPNLIFTNATTDPYTSPNVSDIATLNTNQTTFTNTTLLGDSKYDIGHVFGYGSSGSSGLAYLGTTCSSSKAKGVSLISPTWWGESLDTFSFRVVAHELGHQLGAEHSFNANTGRACVGNRTTDGVSAVEPGAGITIMSYATNCDNNSLNAENNSGLLPLKNMFNGHSIDKIDAYTHVGTGKSCGTTTSTGNQNPVVTLNSNYYVIPARTPFILSAASVTDASGTSKSWEQIDNGTASNKNVDLGNNALIRPLDPVSSLERTIPQMTDLIAGRKTDGEVLPWRARTAMKFRLTARDNLGGVNNADMSLKVVATPRPFKVTAPTGTLTAAYLGTVANKYKVQWDIAQTNVATGVNCQKVDIAATDVNGNLKANLLLGVLNTRDTTIAGEIGSSLVTIPSTVVSNAGGQVRIRVKCSTSPFFGLSGTDPTKHLAQ